MQTLYFFFNFPFFFGKELIFPFRLIFSTNVLITGRQHLNYVNTWSNMEYLESRTHSIQRNIYFRAIFGIKIKIKFADRTNGKNSGLYLPALSLATIGSITERFLL